ncbi:MAG: hypothetical protein IKD23_09440 [Lentisphaeria bacterium]|nr:hypothetical protein [Lentisphaerota bacterium]MBR2626601.1 hypothetical protein [Lentisphaeria bacterium]
MKKLLISINLILAGIIVIVVLGNLTKRLQLQNEKGNKQTSSAVKDDKDKTDTAKEVSSVVLAEPDAAAGKIIDLDVFNQIRSPFANTRLGRSEMSLVGIVINGNSQAAIIKNNTRNRQVNPYLMQAQFMAANMSGNRQQFTQWSRMSGRNSGPAQQYVRLGETMSNGYTLTEVSRTRVVLVRGNDKMELELMNPSRNLSSGGGTRPRLNATQQFQQAQMFMQSQMIRTMREIQQNSRSTAPAGNRNRR